MTPDVYRNHFNLPSESPLQIDTKPDITKK
jgi:hypothetical protein